MPNPICVKCKLFLKPKKSGVTVEEGRPLGDGSEWGPYKLWMADLWECRGCGFELVYGFGRRPVAEHYQPEYKFEVEREPPLLRVNDC